MSNNVTLESAAALVEKIKTAQSAAGMNESRFALAMGISRANWFLIKKGDRGLSSDFLKAVMRVFPELEADILAYMKA